MSSLYCALILTLSLDGGDANQNFASEAEFSYPPKPEVLSLVEDTLTGQDYHLYGQPAPGQMPIRVTGTPEAPTITFTHGCDQNTEEKVVQLYSFDKHKTGPGTQAAALAGRDGCAIALSENYFLSTMKQEEGQSSEDFRADQMSEALFFLIQEIAHSVFQDKFDSSDCAACLKEQPPNPETAPPWDQALSVGCSEFYSKSTTASFLCKEANKTDADGEPAHYQAKRDELKAKADQAAEECEKFESRCTTQKQAAALICPGDCGNYPDPCDMPEQCPGKCDLT